MGAFDVHKFGIRQIPYSFPTLDWGWSRDLTGKAGPTYGKLAN